MHSRGERAENGPSERSICVLLRSEGEEDRQDATALGLTAFQVDPTGFRGVTVPQSGQQVSAILCATLSLLGKNRLLGLIDWLMDHTDDEQRRLGFREMV
jgi:hypothetical protein